ncbi:hypothetical protein [Halovivax sp.]|uniref:hypothetical protein n=1 Tax=Halovivax sp. TaxID=1935978 RepID=UPI0025B7BAB0|nr:hypothetical protein [Halovivax sp.]
MSYANWQCRLYGHQWRHPGEYEVVLTSDVGPAYPFQCEACGARMSMNGNGDRFHDEPDRTSSASEPDLESAAEPDVDARRLTG